MLDEYEKDNDIVYGVRNDRKTDVFLKDLLPSPFIKLWP